ncbi:MAG: hypothetical protein MI810_20860, partial [Flavobacteriales bacterium]|nr:hypothetical protein [Flavobacteriales bacterium]
MESDAELRNWNLCRHLLWPVAKPALLAGGIMVALLTLNQFNVPSLLQVKTWTADLFVTFSATLDWREIVPSICSLVLVSMVGLFLFRGREVHWPLGAGHPSQRHLSHALDPWLASLLTWTAIGWVLLATVFPLLGSLMTRSTWQSLASATAAGQSAWQHSFAFALGTATACLLLGIATWRWRPGRFFWIFFLLPGCVWGVLLLSLSQQSWFPLRGSSLGLTFVALVFRYGILGWLGMRLAMQSLDRDIRDTGRLEIPSAIQRFRCLYAPLVGWLLLASWYVVYLLSLWDADTLLFVIPPGAETLALRIFNLLHYGHNTQVHALILLLMSTALLPWLGWQLWRGVKPLMQRIRPVPMLTLLLGVLGWSFLSACSPEVTSEDSPQTKLDSRFFDQAIIIGTQGRSPGYFIKPRSLTVDAHD